MIGGEYEGCPGRCCTLDVAALHGGVYHVEVLPLPAPQTALNRFIPFVIFWLIPATCSLKVNRASYFHPKKEVGVSFQLFAVEHNKSVQVFSLLSLVNSGVSHLDGFTER